MCDTQTQLINFAPWAGNFILATLSVYENENDTQCVCMAGRVSAADASQCTVCKPQYGVVSNAD